MQLRRWNDQPREIRRPPYHTGHEFRENKEPIRREIQDGMERYLKSGGSIQVVEREPIDKEALKAKILGKRVRK